LKLSEGKATLVGAKQVWRHWCADGFVEDVLAARDEPSPGSDWEPLLEPVVREGQPASRPPLADVRARHRRDIESMPRDLLDLHPKRAYPVRLSGVLSARQRAAVESVRQQ
jgi:nicotinate phosphoribosyltransferase